MADVPSEDTNADRQVSGKTTAGGESPCSTKPSVSAALDALDEQSENLQEDENAPWWKAQQEESDARFEAMDTLGGEQVRRLLAAGH